MSASWPPAGARLEIRHAGLDDPEARTLTDAVQREYTELYGSPDAAPIDADEFTTPHGAFLIGFLGRTPVAMGGWRRHGAEHPETAWARTAAEIKRMYVAPSQRGAGYARALLAELEGGARAAGIEWLLLETGLKQPAAIALYRSEGYADVAPFGHYAGLELSVHLGKPLSELAPARRTTTAPSSRAEW